MKCKEISQEECEKRKRVIIWGAGEKTKEFLQYQSLFDDVVEIIAITDSDQQKWGTDLNGHTVIAPKEAYKLPYDRFIVPSEQYYEEIADRIISDIKTDRYKIENTYYISKCKLAARYKLHPDKADILSYMQKNPVDVFNYPFIKKYEELTPEVGYDRTAGLYYVVHRNLRMYMAKRFDTEEKVTLYYKSLCIEQDAESPHLYLQGNFDVKCGDVVVDVGAAEGFFTAEIIERAKKIYMIEADAEWIEALQYTFRDYQDKIQIMNRFASDYTAYRTAKLDDLILEPVDFIKMDIEGGEYAALTGAKALIEKSPHIRCAMCAYHNDNDEVILKVLAESMGMKVSFSDGYMFFLYGTQQKYIAPTLRRGIIRCEK